MGWRALAFGFGALAVLAGPAAADDCRLTIISSLPSSRDAAGGIIVPATIDGHEKQLLIDTAGIYSLLSESAAADIGIEHRALNTKLHLDMGADSKKLNQGAMARTFTLGNLSVDRMQFAIIPDGVVAKGADGTLGPSIFANYDVEIDPAHNKVNLFSQQHCPGQVVYWTSTPYVAIPMRLDSWLHIIIPVTLDGHTFEAVVDTGSSTSWIVYGLAKDTFGWSESTAEITPDKKDGDGWYDYPFKSLTLNGVDVKNPHILINKSVPTKGQTQLIIGMDVLEKLHSFISYADKTLYFTGANTPPPDQGAK